MKADKVLITGGLGFIGLHVAKLLVEEGRRVRLMDNLSPQVHGDVPDFSALPLLQDANVEVLRADVCDSAGWEVALAEVGQVVHLAAETGTGQSMYAISRYTDTNVGGTAALLNYLANKRHGVEKIILASSRAVYGEGAYRCRKCGVVYPRMRTEQMFLSGQWDPPCPACGGEIKAIATPEDSKTAPASIYGVTKLAQEELVRIAAKALGIPAIIFRFQNVYGEGQSLKNPYTGILSIYSNQLRLGRPVTVYEDGKETRDFVHVQDAARVVMLGLASDGADGHTLNVGSGQPTSIERIAFLLTERFATGKQAIVSGQYRSCDIRHGYADLTNIRQCLGFVPKVTLEHGLDRFVDWVSTQPMEPDRLEMATQELVHRSLMPDHANSKATVV